MKDKLLKMIAAKSQRKADIIKTADGIDNVEELRKLNTELNSLNEELRGLQEMLESLPQDDNSQTGTNENDPNFRTAVVNGEVPGIVSANAKTQQQRSEKGDVEKKVEEIALELRSGNEVVITPDVQEFLEKRAFSTTSVMLETKYKREIADNFNEVSQTIDLVDSVPLDGGNEYEIAFQITDGEADYTDEAGVYTNSEGTFGTASTGRAKITNSAIVNEEVVDLPNADYLTRITNSVKKSIRKKISNQIIAGMGGTNQLKGIYSMPTTLIPETYAVEVTEIDEDTLRKIVFAYGGDEDIEAPSTLFLNKLDLAAFAAIKATGDGRPYYAITYNGSNGFIQESSGGLRVPYTINSACKALADSKTVTGAMTMVYGSPTNYELPLFGPLTIKRSDDRYIDKGQIGFFGKIYAGGVVNKFKGFIPVKKKTA